MYCVFLVRHVTGKPVRKQKQKPLNKSTKADYNFFFFHKRIKSILHLLKKKMPTTRCHCILAKLSFCNIDRFIMWVFGELTIEAGG